MRKILSLLLSLIMLISMAMPSAGAFAEEVQAPAETPADIVKEEKAEAEPVKEEAKECTKESAAEPTKEPTPVPTAEPTPEPTKEPTPAPTKEVTPEPTQAPAEEPVAAASVEEETEDGSLQPVKEQTEVYNNDENVTIETEIQTEVENIDENVTAEPEVTAEPTMAPAEEETAEPTAKPTEEVTAAPTATPSEEVTAEPTVEVTAEPTEEVVEPSEEPTLEPTVEGSVEPTIEPTIEPTVEPTVEPTPIPENTLNVSLKLNGSYAMAEQDKVIVEVTIADGTAPFNVSFYAMKGDSVAYENISEQGESFTLEYEPKEFGKYELVVSVKDANGFTGRANAALEVAVPEVEDADYWKKMAEKIDLTGDWRKDLVSFAETQVGYEASERNYVYNDNGEITRYTRYGGWFGKEYSAWGTMFVSFCMNYAGIDKDAITFTNRCKDLKEELDGIGAYKSVKSAYEPKAGDLVFFNWDKGEAPQHVGIVVSANDDGIKSIEGNINNAVVKQAHDYEDKTIVGFANIKLVQDRFEMLKRAENEEPVAAIENVEGHIVRTNTDRVNLRSEANTNCDVICVLTAAGTKLTVLEAVVSGEKVWYKVEYGSKTGYIRYDLVLFDELPAAEPEVIEPVEPANAAWDGVSEQMTIAYSAGAEAVYGWEKLVDGEWVKIEGADAAELTLDATVENMKYSYRCVATLENGETMISSEVTLVSAEIVEWVNANEVTQEMVVRAMDAKTLDTLVIEGSNVIHVRTGAVVAYFDEVTGYMTDAVSGIAVARVDMETGMVYPVE